MVQQGHGQLPSMGVVSCTSQMPYGTAAYQSNHQMVMPNPPIITSSSTQLTDKPTALSASPSHLAQHQLAYQQIRQQQLHQQLQTFWANQHMEIEQTTDFKNHSLPLARIKKIMKADEDVRMIAAEAPVIFARACEMFILELTLRSWNHTEENKRRTLQKNDIAAAISRTDIFDFLVDIVPREDFKDEVIGIATGSALSIGAPADSLPYFYMPAQNSPQIGAPGMIMGKRVVDQAVYTQQAHPYVAPPMWPQHQLQQQTES